MTVRCRHPIVAPAARVVAGALLACVLSSCQGAASNDNAKGGAKEGEAPAPQPAPAPTPDGPDLSLEDAVPMALFDGALVAQFLERSVGADGASFEALPRQATAEELTRATVDTDTTDYTFSSEVIGLPDRAEALLAANAREVRILLDETFGASGPFGGRELGVPRTGGVARAAYVIPGRGWVVVERALPPAEVFLAKVYDAEARLTTTIEAGRDAAGARRAEVRHRTADASGDTAFLRLELDEAKRDFSVAVRYDAASNTRPIASYVRSLDEADERLLTGGVLWQLSGPATTLGVDPPRYYAPLGGDAELFAQRRSSDRLGPAAQLAMYLRAGETTPREYPELMLEHLVTLVRHEGVNAACATTGAQLRAFFADAAIVPPESVSSVPADLCRARTAVADAAVGAAIVASCAAEINLTLDLSFAGVGATRYHLCAKIAEAAILANPIDVLLQQGGARVVANDRTAHAAINARLLASSPPDASRLPDATSLKFDPEPLSEADRAGAKPVP